MSVSADGTIPELTIDLPYEASQEAWAFHCSTARFRHLLWGSRSGKTIAGAVELLRWVGGLPGTLSWAVAPTLLNLEQAEYEVVRILRECHIRFATRRQKGEIRLPNTSIIRFKSAHEPKNLQGGTVNGIMWIDEFASLLELAWKFLRPRISSDDAPLMTTSTPKGRNWTWPHYVRAGMPADCPYGEFQSEDGLRWISHRPVWHFPWVSKAEIAEMREDMSAEDYQQEAGAMFVTTASKVFPYVQEALSREKIPQTIKGSTALGLDLAKQQDFTAVVVMDPLRRVLHVDRWTKVAWRVQRPRIIERARRWNAVVVIDVANVGSVIAEDLVAAGVTIKRVDMNSAHVKRELIEGLQIAFEQNRVRIPDPDAPWTPSIFKRLVDELDLYEAKLTPGKRIGYGAPKGLHDDLVTGLALANFGVSRGVAGGADPDDVVIAREDFGLLPTEDEDEDDLEDERDVQAFTPRVPRLRRPKVYRSIYGRRNAIGLEIEGGPLFKR